MKIRRKPASRCALCNRLLTFVQEKRVVITACRQLVFREIGEIAASRQMVADELHIGKEGWSEILCLRGEWTAAQIESLRVTAETGLHPWFCQTCCNRTCSLCKYPQFPVMACDVLCDDGDVRHCGIFPVTIRCSNPACGVMGESQPSILAEYISAKSVELDIN